MPPNLEDEVVSTRTPARSPRVAKSRPDPRDLRLAAGVAGLAAASALVSSFLAPIPADTASTQVTTVVDPAPPVTHITRYVVLGPGETAPPQSTVVQQPAPSPRTVIVTTRQSGKKP